MKINKKSWHYKVVMFYCEYTPPVSLCEYFWSFWAGLFQAALYVALAPIWIPIGGVIVLYCIVADKLSILHYKWRQNKGWEIDNSGFLQPSSKKPKGSNFVVAYWHAFKNKVCPLIQYTDE